MSEKHELMLAGICLPDERSTRPFLTGSRAYGTPGPKSDYDVVCLLKPEQIAAIAGMFPGVSINADRDVRWIGPINLILCAKAEDYLAWKRVTRDLIKRSPVSREEAVAAFNAAGVTGYAGESPI